MANLCASELKIEGNKLEIEKFLEQGGKPVHSNPISPFSLENFVPTPTDIEDVDFWHIKNWGINSDVNVWRITWDNRAKSADEETFVEMKFDTEDSPPFEAFDKISKLYPKLKFQITYLLSKQDLCGIGKYDNGLQYQKSASHSERFSLKLSLDYQNIQVEDEIISIPLNVSGYPRLFDFESKELSDKCTLVLPIDMSSDSIGSEYNNSIKVYCGKEISELVAFKENEIINFITDNLNQLKTSAEHHKLDKSLPINESAKKSTKKI